MRWHNQVILNEVRNKRIIHKNKGDHKLNSQDVIWKRIFERGSIPEGSCLEININMIHGGLSWKLVIRTKVTINWNSQDVVWKRIFERGQKIENILEGSYLKININIIHGGSFMEASYNYTIYYR